MYNGVIAIITFSINLTVLLRLLLFSTQVSRGWLKDPESNGEVAVSGVSVGEHYFACSVGDHCLRGMRMRVNVQPRTGQEHSQDNDVGVRLLKVLYL